MALPIPKWLMERYAQLFQKYKDKTFTFQEAMKVVDEEDKVYMSIILSELRKAGWLKTEINQDDARRRIYQLILPEQIIVSMEERRQK